MSVYEIINEIALTESKNAKQAIVQKHKDNDHLKKAFFYAYNKRITFGVSSVSRMTTPKGTANLDEFFNLLEKLNKREYSGNAAIEILTNTVESLSEQDSLVARAVIRRDLECGVGVGTIDKVWPGLIPAQPQMLAQPAKKKNVDKIKLPAYAQLKADGARCFVTVMDGKVTFTSRSGKEYQGLNQLAEQFLELHRIHSYPIEHPAMVYDGELVVHDENGVTDRSSSNGIANKALAGTISDEEQKAMKIEVWDVVRHEHYYGEGSTVPYCDRFEYLSRYLGRLSHENAKVGKEDSIILIENNVVSTLDEAVEVYKRYIEQGYEGIILKNIHAPWENKRSVHQVKFKQIIDVDLEIVDVYEHNKDPNKAGGFVLRSADGLIETKCGSGLKDTGKYRDKVTKQWVHIPLEERDYLDRERVMANKEEYIGRIAKLECNGAVKSKGRKDGEAPYKLFLPIIKEVRDDKEVANDFDDVDWTGTAWLR